MNNTIILRNGTSAFKDCRTIEQVSVLDQWFFSRILKHTDNSGFF